MVSSAKRTFCQACYHTDVVCCRHLAVNEACHLVDLGCMLAELGLTLCQLSAVMAMSSHTVDLGLHEMFMLF